MNKQGWGYFCPVHAPRAWEGPWLREGCNKPPLIVWGVGMCGCMGERGSRRAPSKGTGRPGCSWWNVSSLPGLRQASKGRSQEPLSRLTGELLTWSAPIEMPVTSWPLLPGPSERSELEAYQGAVESSVSVRVTSVRVISHVLHIPPLGREDPTMGTPSRRQLERSICPRCVIAHCSNAWEGGECLPASGTRQRYFTP